MNGLQALNGDPPDVAAAKLSRCCGAQSWVAAMVEARPFRDTAHLYAEAERQWKRMGRAEILEAFTHHPRIGDVEKLRERFPATATLSEAEQEGVVGAREATLRALLEANQAYEARFGYRFIVCATGKSADQMLELLRARLANAADPELQVAAAEQGKITRLRLERLLSA
jgi:2-oxo-4-hydroxy-4-carboxy-5-ureidoimidazoline decarboxylase